MSGDPNVDLWVDKLEIRELIERSVRHVDDQDAAAFADLFEDDGVLQLAGTVFAGQDALRAMFGGAPRREVDGARWPAAPAREHAPHRQPGDRDRR